ncbi:MAG: Transcription-repair coupling factor [Parcubacteria group bacterium GW2011_GWA2_37_10]|nr:MAG: Transcription-repair coupling factor [Parcubacteria group bacterium GW2011_GWA2_37_10]
MDKLNSTLIVSITPYFLEKEAVWFEENLEKVLRAGKTQSFFYDNTAFLEKGKNYNFSQFLRKLDEMGYERVFVVREPGEFSQRGGIVDIFPINAMQSVRLDFLGNKLEIIELLDIKIDDEKKYKEILKKRLKSQKIFSDLKNLKPGDYLVHLDHGIARYCGIEKFDLVKYETSDIAQACAMSDVNATSPNTYYVLEYAQNDKLYVPVGLERKLSRYVGFADPKISRLASLLWQKTKNKLKKEIEKLAKELLNLYAKKEVARRAPYQMDEELESELRSSFLYEETPDQLQAIENIKKDLSGDAPMDRIVCGDVGFGKTEVAMRTALMSASNNKQTAIICPTTILANQHFNNFKKRFERLPVKISQLTRLKTKTEQKKILRDLEEGRIDILIGTHRILSSDVKFKSLQLLIIDDEQRFGVKQKEALREKNPSLDILSLSATPIPRTIYLALSSFKNISLVQTPPQGRTAINTKILPYNIKLIKKAINSELKRSGQVYFLHNRVESLEKKRDEIKNLAPSAKIGLMHGRMPEKKIIKIMDDFQNQKIDVLLATTIIENGLDLPNVNTIIIEDASRLGLSQAHQIRGRVGRSNINSFAYFLFNPKHMTSLVKERLRALEDAKELGAGYRIAIKDLEIRGAGNILGREQSGAINKIGLNLYSQILSEAVEKLRQ